MKRYWSKIQRNKLISDKKASFWLPIRLLMSIAIISFFTFLIVLGSQNATKTMINNDFLNEMQNIKGSLESLHYYGNCRDTYNLKSTSGSKRVFTIEIPDCIKEIYFGKKEGESDELCSSIRLHYSNKVKMIWLNTDIKLIKGDRDENQWYPNENYSGLELIKGYYDVTAELVCDRSDQFILLYFN